MTTKRRQSSRTKKATSAAKPNKTAPKSKQYTRPGVEAAARLVSLRPSSDHVGEWERAYSHYAAMIEAKGGAKLVALDKRRDDLAMTWAAKSACTMTKDQLLDVIIEWKFAKGKPRHALKPLLRSNSEASVVAAAKLAFDAADAIPKNDASGRHTNQISSAIKQLCVLNGVGPATASAILSIYRPDMFAFMDDEVIECLYDAKRGYTLKIYMEVNDRCREIASEFNSDSGLSEWTPCSVGKALWAVATASATNDEDGLSAIFESADSNNSHKRTKTSAADS
eukprot:CAMPEP_0181122312 /NCGR_PEP_ID=MMETSP1071-20121207/25243_1 /TAXON_ID=35127 /ORGANISM="Thalassiosira sp., Strain NH16" /LENGTH=280 /DNA_ID=CAMNT_0023207267 /DNA_START=122 /DNA_END=964 /DNA_ORIENTATION=-